MIIDLTKCFTLTKSNKNSIPITLIKKINNV